MRWTMTILSVWAVLWIVTEVPRVAPASWWFSAGEIHIDTPTEGTCPEMTFSRDINREFHASWTVTLMRLSPWGSFYTFRTPWTGANDYRPGNALPDDLDLCWWTGVEDLRLPDGQYRVHTLWRIRVGSEYKEVRRTSNIFEVRNRPA